MVAADRWLKGDALALQLGEVGGRLSMLDQAPDPLQARKWFVSLCLFRHSPQVKSTFERQLTEARGRAGYTPVASWIISLKFQCEDKPEELPFCLSDREFAYYATKEFGGRIADVAGIYKPPSFYAALAGDLFGAAIGIAAGVVAIAAIPEEATAAALSAPAFATAGGRAAISGAAGAVTSHLLPSGAFEAGEKRRLWPRYLAEQQRRLLR